jgi:hypothetical protein
MTQVPATSVDVRTMKPATPPGPGPTLTRTWLTRTDDRAVIITRPGRSITIDLPGTWDRPRVSDTRIVHQVTVTGGYPATSGLRVRLVAAIPGQADVATQTDMACLHADPSCAPAQQTWRVRIKVR